MNLSTASAVSRGSLKTLTGHYDGKRVVLACRTVEDFLAVTRIPRGFVYGESGNYEEIAVAMANIGTPYARPLKDLNAPFTEWQRPTATQRKRRTK